jgi:antitoxin MazE
MITEQFDIQIVQIGSSRGIRIPKKILDRIGLRDHVTAIVTDNSITLKPSLNPRDGWESDFKRCHDEGNDTLLIPDTLDADEWDNL